MHGLLLIGEVVGVMDERAIFLTAGEAVDAIAIDFRQYEPQILLFCSIIGLITANEIHFQREPGKAGVWVSRRGHVKMRWLEGDNLIGFMCSAVRDTCWTIELLAEVCSRVFQGRAQPAVHQETGRQGLLIETHTEDFTCRKCGRCCRSLDYHHDIKTADVALWKSLGRDDVLKWVAPITTSNRDDPAGYRIWVVPGTHRLADQCPFLKREPGTDQWICEIHTIKPAICRNYPVSRKHATMTGCQGFNKSGRKKTV